MRIYICVCVCVCIYNAYIQCVLLIIITIALSLSDWMGGWVSLTSLCGFSKNVSYKERVNPWFFVAFIINIRHIFPENFIEIPLVV